AFFAGAFFATAFLAAVFFVAAFLAGAFYLGVDADLFPVGQRSRVVSKGRCHRVDAVARHVAERGPAARRRG
ncbi:hypothetical protein AB0B67_43375, partial [Streptomyces spectabilis]